MQSTNFDGIVTKIISQHDAQQIFRVLSGKKSIKVVTYNLQSIFEAGDHIEVTGCIEIHEKHGEQVIAHSVNLCDITSDLIHGFLVSTNGIGDKTANKLMRNLGSDLTDTIESRDIDRLISVGKVSKAAANIICTNWHKKAGKIKLIKFMRDILTKLASSKRNEIIKTAQKAFAFYGIETEEKLKDDPYRIWAFSTFKQADQFASALGVAKNDKRRLVCAVEEVLFFHLKRGSTQVAPLVFAKDLERLIGNALVIEAIIRTLDESKSPEPRVVVFEPKGVDHLSEREKLYHRKFALRSAVIIENYVTDQLHARLNQNIAQVEIHKLAFESYSLPGGFVLSFQQKNAVQLILQNSISCISGGAGTGKTSVLHCAHSMLTSSGNSVLQVALSGKASRRLAQQTQQDAMTIEKLLRTIEHDPNYIDQFNNPLVLIDEASMVDVHAMYRILKVLENKPARLVFVGDWAQLSPIGPGLVYHKLMKSNLVPKVELTQNFRSVSSILDASESVKKGEHISSSKEVHIVECKANDALEKVAVRQYELHMHTKSLHVIAARTRTVAAVNLALHKVVTHSRKVIKCAPYFRVGDAVIYKANNEALGIVNGSTGTVVDGNADSIYVEFDIEGRVNIPKEEVICSKAGEYLLQHGYALTCHAAQGSEFDVVIVVLENIPLVERSWLYTAITRAKKKVVLITSMVSSIDNVFNRGFSFEKREVGLEL